MGVVRIEMVMGNDLGKRWRIEGFQGDHNGKKKRRGGDKIAVTLRAF